MTFEEEWLQMTAAVPRQVSKARSGALSNPRILVPVDFSTASQAAFEYALRLAGQIGASLTLLYVIPPGPSPVCENSTAGKTCCGGCVEGKFRSFLAVARKDSAPVEWMIRRGLPSLEIVEAARESQSDLIVIATHGYTGWKHFCIGSTAERVVQAAPCPVLVVRTNRARKASVPAGA